MDEIIYKVARERFDKKIIALQNAENELEEIKDMPHAQGVFFWENKLDIDIPYNLTMLNEVAAFLVGHGWVETWRKYFDTHGVLIVIFEKLDSPCEIKITLETRYAGSTCKLNKVGERAEPIYETVCMEV